MNRYENEAKPAGIARIHDLVRMMDGFVNHLFSNYTWLSERKFIDKWRNFGVFVVF